MNKIQMKNKVVVHAHRCTNEVGKMSRSVFKDGGEDADSKFVMGRLSCTDVKSVHVRVRDGSGA
jgi:hypothetical protein